jgi:hypothetical protein
LLTILQNRQPLIARGYSPRGALAYQDDGRSLCRAQLGHERRGDVRAEALERGVDVRAVLVALGEPAHPRASREVDEQGVLDLGELDAPLEADLRDAEPQDEHLTLPHHREPGRFPVSPGELPHDAADHRRLGLRALDLGLAVEREELVARIHGGHERHRDRQGLTVEGMHGQSPSPPPAAGAPETCPSSSA